MQTGAHLKPLAKPSPDSDGQFVPATGTKVQFTFLRPGLIFASEQTRGRAVRASCDPKGSRTLLIFGRDFLPSGETPFPGSEFVVQNPSVKIRPEFREGVASHCSQESPQGAQQGIVASGFTVCPPGV